MVSHVRSDEDRVEQVLLNGAPPVVMTLVIAVQGWKCALMKLIRKLCLFVLRFEIKSLKLD